MVTHIGFLRRRVVAATHRAHVQRSGVASRRDNNQMYALAERLEDTADRIKPQCA